MAHYKETERGQKLFLTIDLSEQLIPGTYEYTLKRLIDNKLHLSIFDCKYNNNYTGAAAIKPHYTTVSNFVSGMSNEIEKIFSQVLLVCNGMGLIRGKMFAIDGCRLPSNASKEWSGTKDELKEKYENMKKICKVIIEKHLGNDILGKEEGDR